MYIYYYAIEIKGHSVTNGGSLRLMEADSFYFKCVTYSFDCA